MKNRYKSKPAKSYSPLRIEPSLLPAGPTPTEHEASFERLKLRLVNQSLLERPEKDFDAPLRRAVSEAASLAWLTPFPLLFFPALFEEKLTEVARRESRQREIRGASPRFIEGAE